MRAEEPTLDGLRAGHTPEAIRLRLRRGPPSSYLKDVIYGAMDGTVTTFAVVSAAHGAGLGSGVIMIVGIANLAADGFSMAVGNFLGTRAELERRQRARREEEAHVRLIPEGEREEVRQIFAAKGFRGSDLERAVSIITGKRRRWVETMLREELGLPWTRSSPWRAGAATFAAFVAAGSVPLLSYFFGYLGWGVRPDPFDWSVALSAVVFFSVGALKARFLGRPALASGLESLTAGGAAAGLAWAVGAVLRGLA